MTKELTDYEKYLLHTQGYNNHIITSYDKREPWERIRDAHEEFIAEYEGRRLAKTLEEKIEAKALEILQKDLTPINVKIKL